MNCVHTVRLFANVRWLQIFLAAALLLTGPAIFAFTANTPVTPGASPETQSLLACFSKVYGQKIISGQQDGWRRTNGLSAELNYITNTTGKLPALLALDIGPVTDKPAREGAARRLVQNATDWFNERHGILELCCHWRAPMEQPEFYTKDTTFDIARAVTEGTPEYAATERDLDQMAAVLESLCAAHVPVLWRPLHEANGRWFWWGAGGPEPFKKLWRMMFENFTVKHHLNNLIWVFSPGAETDLAEWYPGDEYVDIIGQDHYPMDGNHLSAKDVFDELNQMTRGRKLIALGENGPIPDPALMKKDRAGWLFFTTWSGSILFEKTTPEELRAYYNNPYVITLADLPDLKLYPFKPAGPAVKLGFDGAPGDVAIGGTWRSPLTVAVEDKNGKTIRDQTWTVTLALKNPGSVKLTGTLTASTVNGIATFADVSIDRAGKYQLVATANSLRPATSAAFHAGPGDGLLRQWWTGTADAATAADPSEILDRALETPVMQATNFSARITGLLIPPRSGNYEFWLAGGGVAELNLGTNASPDSQVVICRLTTDTPYQKWPHTSMAASDIVKLRAGQKYYFEIQQHQPAGSTQLNVRWRLPDGTEERPIPAFRFSQPEQ